MMWFTQSTTAAIPADCNTGGPCSRTRSEPLRATVLGRQDGTIRCPCSTVLALEFDGKDPLETIYDLLDRSGIAGPEALKTILHLPDTPAICRPNDSIVGLNVATADHEEVLETALLLGLCTPWLYDPSRPVLWTRASLERRLELFEGEGFYA